MSSSEQIRLELVKALIATGELKASEHTSLAAARANTEADLMERVRQKVDALEDLVYQSVTLRRDRQQLPVRLPGTLRNESDRPG